MKTLDEVIDSITTQSGLEIRNVRKPENDRFWVDRETYNDALCYLRMYKELANDSEMFAKWKEERTAKVNYSQKDTCGECGRVVFSGWAYCPSCGARLEWK